MRNVKFLFLHATAAHCPLCCHGVERLHQRTGTATYPVHVGVAGQDNPARKHRAEAIEAVGAVARLCSHCRDNVGKWQWLCLARESCGQSKYLSVLLPVGKLTKGLCQGVAHGEKKKRVKK